jgi:hypothetical protein
MTAMSCPQPNLKVIDPERDLGVEKLTRMARISHRLGNCRNFAERPVLDL